MSTKNDKSTRNPSTPNVDNSPNSRARLLRSALHFSKPSRTVRSVADETDINRMVAGLTPFTAAARSPFFIDETVFPSTLEDHYNNLDSAHDAFMALPPAVREAFGNDPAVLAKALGDPSQAQRLIDFGLIPGEVTQRAPNAGGVTSPIATGGPEIKEVTP